MNRRLGLAILIMVLLLTMWFTIVSLPRITAAVTIYIKTDGSVEPVTAPILSADNMTYIFTDNISMASIRVERDNVVIHSGAQYTLSHGSIEIHDSTNARCCCLLNYHQLLLSHDPC